MKEHTQTIINVCFAISITAFIYQNDKLNDELDRVESLVMELDIELGALTEEIFYTKQKVEELIFDNELVPPLEE